MADVEIGRDARIYADIPGLTDDDAVAIEITDPHGESIVAGEFADTVGDGRVAYTWLAENNEVEGAYTLNWIGAGGDFSIRQKAYAGQYNPTGVTKSRLRRLVAQRVVPVHHGTIFDPYVDRLVDPTLVGSQSHYVNWWLVIEGDNDLSGMVRRVAAFEGNGLVLSHPLPEEPDRGTEYTLYAINPREVDDAIAAAFSDFGEISRVPMMVTGCVLDDELQTPVPDGFTHLTDVYREEVDDDEETLVSRSNWSPYPGKLIQISEDADLDEGDTVTVAGTRNAAAPIWEFSTTDIEVQALVARAAYNLHAARAGGPGVDTREHLRRQIAAFNEQEATMKRAAGRKSSRSRQVIY